MIKDSGERKEFESGAVRDMSDGKGYPVLMPLMVIGGWLHEPMFCEFEQLEEYMTINDWGEAIRTIGKIQEKFRSKAYVNRTAFLIALSKHFENGMMKYSRDNWKKGIPYESYINSAIRHYVKWLDGFDDEDHAAAFLWNLSALEWSILNGVYYEVENNA